MTTTNEILQAYAPIGVDVVKKALEEVRASGKTIESVRSEVSQKDKVDRLQILARPYTNRIEKGIGPTTKGPSSEMIQNLTEYARARGMDDPKKAAWAIAKKIQKEGDKTHKRGGRIVYSDDVDKFVKEVTGKVKSNWKVLFTSTIKNAFNES